MDTNALIAYIISELTADQSVELHHKGTVAVETLFGDYIVTELADGAYRLYNPCSDTTVEGNVR